MHTQEPRWGRNIETPGNVAAWISSVSASREDVFLAGEDPYLSSEYAENFVRGFQEAPEDPFHLQASACCKHYVANEMESTTDGDGEHHDRHEFVPPVR